MFVVAAAAALLLDVLAGALVVAVEVRRRREVRAFVRDLAALDHPAAWAALFDVPDGPGA